MGRKKRFGSGKLLKNILWKFNNPLSYRLIDAHSKKTLASWDKTIGRDKAREMAEHYHNERFGSSNEFFYVTEIFNTYTREHWLEGEYRITIDPKTGQAASEIYHGKIVEFRD